MSPFPLACVCLKAGASGKVNLRKAFLGANFLFTRTQQFKNKKAREGAHFSATRLMDELALPFA